MGLLIIVVILIVVFVNKCHEESKTNAEIKKIIDEHLEDNKRLRKERGEKW